MEYQKAKSGRTRYSVVDLKNKEVDSYDTWSLYTGMQYAFTPEFTLMRGYLNEPGSIGPGAKGDDEKTGFGFMDLAQNLGNPPSRPQWIFSAGAQFNFMKEGDRGSDKSKGDRSAKEARGRKQNYYKLNLESGITYGETSIGIDETGEQPGAYLVRRFGVPFKLTYRF